MAKRTGGSICPEKKERLGWIGTLATGLIGKIFLGVIIANFATFMVWVVCMGLLMLIRKKPLAIIDVIEQ